ncbi:hypothetical protein D3C87_1449350 [compost metagenome]
MIVAKARERNEMNCSDDFFIRFSFVKVPANHFATEIHSNGNAMRYGGRLAPVQGKTTVSSIYLQHNGV